MPSDNNTQPSPITDPSPVRRLYRLIHDIYVQLDDGDRRVLESFGLSSAQFAVLMALDEQSGNRITTLSERLLRAKSTITRLVDGLEKAGLVKRINDQEDRRALNVILTPEGSELRHQAELAHQRSLERRLAALPEADRYALEELLKSLRIGLHVELQKR
jgi:DNA-binding MarR family transcriptional regulator